MSIYLTGRWGSGHQKGYPARPKSTAVMMLLRGSIVATDKAETYLQSIRSRVLESERVHGSVTTDFVRWHVQQDRGIGFLCHAPYTNSEEPAQSQPRLSSALSKAWSTLCVLHRVAIGL